MSNWRVPPEKIPEESVAECLETEVAVIGLGYAGSAALRAAAEQGAKAIGIESMSEAHFTAYGRDIGHINSKFLRSRGIPPVDPLDFYNEWMRRASNRANPSLIMKHCRNCGEAFDWFTDMYGVEGLDEVHVAFWPGASEKFDGKMSGYDFWRGTAQFPEPRGWSGHPTLSEVCLANHQKARESGAQTLYSTEALYLETEGRRVVGLIAKRRNGEYIRIRAEKGVILAAGDCSGNTDMLKDLATGVSDLFLEGEEFSRGLGRNGRGLQMGVWAGGRLEAGPMATMGGDYFTPFGVIGTMGVLWLDPEGKRYCNENFGDATFAGMPAAQMPRGCYYHLFDSNMTATLDRCVPSKGSFDGADPVQVRVMQEGLEGARNAGPGGFSELGRTMLVAKGKNTVYAGNTLEELLDNAGIEGELRDNMLASIHRYNALCSSKRDEDFGKDPKLLYPLVKPPFYMQLAEHGTPGFMLVTVGGLITDEDQNVLDQEYGRIPGLFATGNCCGRRFGYHYSTPISGVSISIAITLGREAGLVAAGGGKEKQWI